LKNEIDCCNNKSLESHYRDSTSGGFTDEEYRKMDNFEKYIIKHRKKIQEVKKSRTGRSETFVYYATPIVDKVCLCYYNGYREYNGSIVLSKNDYYPYEEFWKTDQADIFIKEDFFTRIKLDIFKY